MTQARRGTRDGDLGPDDLNLAEHDANLGDVTGTSLGATATGTSLRSSTLPAQFSNSSLPPAHPSALMVNRLGLQQVERDAA